MGNERKTEQLVRKMLTNAGYYDDNNIIIEEQSSENPKINKLLKNASKTGNGPGHPEFIISFINEPDSLILIECKAKTTQHESSNGQSPKHYAVDGVLLYASYLHKEFDVTAIAVSGENEQEQKISTFLWQKENYQYKNIQNKLILNPEQLKKIIDQQKTPISEEKLIDKAVEYNKKLHRYSVPEVERCTIISSILVALQNKSFVTTYKNDILNKRLIENIINSCKQVLEDKKLSQDKIDIIIHEYSKYKNNKQLTDGNMLKSLIIDIDDNILPHIKTNQFDVLGKFYTQFIKYAGSDQKIGLVLTPQHITDFFL